ncbi:MAG TPA: hypothetical protein VKP64_03630 [Mycobacteriales bacterium]|nr:hypothetical protein [Mycobacteriales bacterium]
MRSLHRRTARADPAELINLVRSVAADETLWRPLVRFQPTERWWTRLHADDAVDVWLLTWLRDRLDPNAARSAQRRGTESRGGGGGDLPASR